MGDAAISRRSSSFAVTFVADPSTSYGHVFKSSSEPTIEQAAAIPQQQKTRAPEPGSFAILLAGVTGFLVRFIRTSFKRCKRLFDMVAAMAAIITLSPLAILAVILIKLTSPGPVIYRQKRMGRHGRIFTMFKLRTMRSDAEKNTGAIWAQANDPRITSVGRILRKSHIDEIPQFINVLKGDMSVIGPRPERPEIVGKLTQLVTDYTARLRVKPGITGLAQVSHNYDETIEDVRIKIRYDLEYIRQMRAGMDMNILARTVVSVATGRGAH